MLAEFVGPEVGIGGALVDPVGVHPGKEIVSSKRLDESVDCRTGVRGHGVEGAVGTRGCLRRGEGVVLAAANGILVIWGFVKVVMAGRGTLGRNIV